MDQENNSSVKLKCCTESINFQLTTDCLQKHTNNREKAGNIVSNIINCEDIGNTWRIDSTSKDVSLRCAMRSNKSHMTWSLGHDCQMAAILDFRIIQKPQEGTEIE